MRTLNYFFKKTMLIKKTDITYLLIYGSLAVDTLNGYLIRAHSISISPIYKAVILLLCLIHLKSKIKYIAILLITSIFILAHSLQSLTQYELLQSLDWMVKFLFIYVLFEFMSKDMVRGRNDKAIKLAVISFSVISINILLGWFGFGYAQYTMGEAAIGTRGFFYAGNELSVALTCATGIIMVHLSTKTSAKYFVFSFMAIAVASMTTMKASTISIAILMIALPFLNPQKTGKKFSIHAKKSLALLVAPAALIFAGYYSIYQTDLISRLTYFYEKNGFISLLFSQRNIWAMEALNEFKSYSFFSMLFGRGLLWTNDTLHLGIVEIDPVDILMSYGVVGVAIIYGFFTWVVLRALKNKGHDKGKHMLLLISLIVLISFTAGHVVFSGIAAPLIALVLSYGTYTHGRNGTSKLT